MSESGGLGQGLRICISNLFSNILSNADAAGPGVTLGSCGMKAQEEGAGFILCGSFENIFSLRNGSRLLCEWGNM